ncbi:MAG: SP_1767 family glycosyltransferase [Bacteroidales bacterium]|jgi:glycosyltransferase family protein|nr:SP_1767 family glycosyltransferase [Bacteroidales bacterium]
MNIIGKIKFKLKYGFTVLYYSVLYQFRKKRKITPEIISISDTIRKIVDERCSVSRFGDGELLLIGNCSIGFQEKSEALSVRLVETLQSKNKKHMVCLSDTFRNLNRYTGSCKRFWRTHFYCYGHLWDKYLMPGRKYYNTFMSRPYMDFKSKANSGEWFLMLQKIWKDRDIVFIEGDKSRLGVGNDLFEGAKSIRRILCPAKNAFEKYDEIYREALAIEGDVLFLIALGPTATVLAYDLFKAGRQAVDIGHVDIEYEWFRMGVKRKVPIPSKHVNELPYATALEKISDRKYLSEIIKKIA